MFPATGRGRSKSHGRGDALAIKTRGQLLAEAGTGTGKTFAYLVPPCFPAAR
jgi:Rad3-related DNA helicase